MNSNFCEVFNSSTKQIRAASTAVEDTVGSRSTAGSRAPAMGNSAGGVDLCHRNWQVNMVECLTMFNPHSKIKRNEGIKPGGYAL